MQRDDGVSAVGDGWVENPREVDVRAGLAGADEEVGEGIQDGERGSDARFEGFDGGVGELAATVATFTITGGGAGFVFGFVAGCASKASMIILNIKLFLSVMRFGVEIFYNQKIEIAIFPN